MMKTNTKTMLNRLLNGSLIILGVYIAGFIIPLLINMATAMFNYTLFTIAGTIAIICGTIAYNEKEEK